MKPSTKQILRVLNVIVWIIFFGLCIKTGAIFYSFFVSLVINPVATHNLYMGLNLSDLARYSQVHYATVVSIIIICTALKAFIFYLAMKIYLKINFMNPFSDEVATLIAKIGYASLGVGLLTLILSLYCEWLATKGVSFPDSQAYLGGTGEFLFIGGIVFMISQVFKRGIEIQSENELTV